ncbi:Bgt-1691 [Blumeria graminis f. sp. tritici]|uniref:Bgt-1691 n=2 Tax=Blumeria graminis f. sp. tritici TaxID=62690 RepID=A0A9X9PR89_BLUGR|nr:hypothetical protein BGT96224_1691 [Blumeria graminis f. sp. tritici 96224]VCU40022.1 Bgt-1691 [Blumeria graminis f. sp. tritici]
MLLSASIPLSFLVWACSAYSPSERTFTVNHFYGQQNLITARMDPILSPDGPSGHVHAVQGGNAFAMSMSDEQALKSTCTSSLVKNDKSNYWTPALYFQDPETGKLEAVELSYMQVYYFFEATSDVIKPFPPGLRIVVGDPSLRTPPATGGLLINDLSEGTPQPVQWTCPRSNDRPPLYPENSDGLNGAGIQDPRNPGSGVGFPDRNCDGFASPLRADIHFPSCYNPDAGLRDYKNNMQFPTKGNCPSGWVHVPHLFYEVYWDTAKFADRWSQGDGSQPFVLANGDPTGYSLHGDFIAGWDVQTLQQIIDNCNTGTSAMHTCPGLIGGLEDPSTTCTIDNPFPKEAVSGVLSALPGDNPIGAWGRRKKSVRSSLLSSFSGLFTAAEHANALLGKRSSIVSSPRNAQLQPGWSYVGCHPDNDRENNFVANYTSLDLAPKSLTNAKCVAYCERAGYSIASTRNGSQCYCNNATTFSKKIPSNSCDVPCEGDTSQTCGGTSSISAYSKDLSYTKTRPRIHKNDIFL